MSNIDFDLIDNKNSIRSHADLLKEKQKTEYVTSTSKEQVNDLMNFSFELSFKK